MITVTLSTKFEKGDYQFDENMKVGDLLRSLDVAQGKEFIYSSRLRKFVSIHYTFKEAKIMTGDTLLVEEQL